MADTTKEIRAAPHPKCFLCDVEGKPLHRGLVDPFFSAPGVWNFKRCSRDECGLIWLDPAPFPEDLYLAYQKYFTHGEQDGEPGLSMRIRGFLYSGYQFLARAPAMLTGLQQSKCEAQLMFLHDLKPGKLLDVGCGDGLFLNRMRSVGWTVDGVDFDERAIKNAKAKYNLDLRHGDLHDAGFPDERFDAVTLSHVIEHVPDPIRLMREMKRILKPAGRVVLTTPNNRSIGHQKFGPYWFGLDAPRHLQVFSLASLAEMARRAGFQNVRSFSSAANADIFLGASYSIRDAKDHRTSDQPAPNIARTAKAVVLQHREHARLNRQPACGEEAVIICS